MEKDIKIIDDSSLNLRAYYKKILSKHIDKDKSILYVGYESNDFLLDLIDELSDEIIIIDKKINKILNKHVFIEANILDIDNVEHRGQYDVAIISFVLHENNFFDQKSIIEKLKKIANKIILIEPMPREEKYNKILEKYIIELMNEKGIYKKYENIDYWTKLSSSVKQAYLLKRNKYLKLSDENRNKLLNIFREHKSDDIFESICKVGIEVQDICLLVF